MGQTVYPTKKEAADAIVDVGRRMYEKGFVAANDGNISVRLSEAEILTTPTGVSKGYLTPDMLVTVDLKGNRLEGRLSPSSELKMHLRLYRENASIAAVVHAHPPHATAFAAAGVPLDQAILQEAVVQLGAVPVAPYALPGTEDVCESVAPFCQTYNGVLLAYHGAVSWGTDLLQAYYRMESIEYYATVTLYCKMLGVTGLLSDKQVDDLLALRPKFGISSGGRPKSAGDASRDGA